LRDDNANVAVLINTQLQLGAERARGTVNRFSGLLRLAGQFERSKKPLKGLKKCFGNVVTQLKLGVNEIGAAIIRAIRGYKRSSLNPSRLSRVASIFGTYIWVSAGR
jgi:hypothetical protein